MPARPVPRKRRVHYTKQFKERAVTMALSKPLSARIKPTCSDLKDMGYIVEPVWGTTPPRSTPLTLLTPPSPLQHQHRSSYENGSGLLRERSDNRRRRRCLRARTRKARSSRSSCRRCRCVLRARAHRARSSLSSRSSRLSHSSRGRCRSILRPHLSPPALDGVKSLPPRHSAATRSPPRSRKLRSPRSPRPPSSERLWHAPPWRLCLDVDERTGGTGRGGCPERNSQLHFFGV